MEQLLRADSDGARAAEQITEQDEGRQCAEIEPGHRYSSTIEPLGYAPAKGRKAKGGREAAADIRGRFDLDVTS